MNSLVLSRQAADREAPISLPRVSETTLISSLWSGVAISSIFLLSRTIIRFRVFGRLQADDPFVIAAWILSIANAVIWTAVRKELYFNVQLATGHLTQIPPDFLRQIERLFRGNLAAYILSYVSLWSIKISFLVFFRKFGDKLRNQRIAWYAVLVFCLASFVVCIGTVDYRCSTSSAIKMIQLCMEPRTINFEFITLRLTTALDVLTDFSIILLSTNVLWRIQLRIWTKIALAGIFSLTIFVIAIAIIRVVVSPLDGKLDLSWLVCWNGIELSVAIIVVSLASFRILYTSIQNSGRHPPTGQYQEHSEGVKKTRTRSSEHDQWTELSNASSRAVLYPSQTSYSAGN